MKQSSFDATISALDAETLALDVETSAFMAATSAIARRSFDATISALDAETSSLDAETSSLDAETLALGVATSAIARSYQRYWRGVTGDCGVGITPQMCNRVTNHGDMSTFSKPVSSLLPQFLCHISLSCCSHAQVFGRTLVHEFHIFYIRTDWNLLFQI